MLTKTQVEQRRTQSSAPEKPEPPDKWVYSRILPKIISIVGGNDGLNRLPRNVQYWVPYFTAWLKEGFSHFSVTIEEITRAHHRAVPGSNSSRRSTFRAFEWLEQNGWLNRDTLRLGEDNRRVVIHLNAERFKFFMWKTKFTLSYMYDGSVHVPTWPYLDLTSIPSTSEIQTYNYYANTANSNGRTKQQNEQNKNTTPGIRPEHNWHPVKASVWVVLKNNKAPDMGAVLRRIDAELAGVTETTSVPWDYWTPDRWYQMPHAEREGFAAADIIPRIRRTVELNQLSVVPEGNLDALVDSLCDTIDDRYVEIPDITPETEPPTPKKPKQSKQSILDPETLAELRAIQQRWDQKRTQIEREEIEFKKSRAKCREKMKNGEFGS